MESACEKVLHYSLHATKKFTDEGPLAEISGATGQPSSAFATLTVGQDTDMIFSAILQFSLLYKINADDTERNAQTAVGSSHYRPEEELIDEDPDGDGGNIIEPGFQFDFLLGNMVKSVKWPPPKHLMSNTSGVTQKTSTKTEESNSKVFHVLRAGGSMYESEIIIATTHLDKDLREFCQGVVEWYKIRHAVKKAVPQGDQYRVFRYVIKDFDRERWRSDGIKNSRNEKSVILAEGEMKDILTDIEKFQLPETLKWYKDHGIPQRRSILFYGTPGTGKSSTIKVIASKYKLMLCFLSMGDGEFSNKNFENAIMSLPKR